VRVKAGVGSRMRRVFHTRGDILRLRDRLNGRLIDLEQHINERTHILNVLKFLVNM
jgi:hypothetical protein